MGRPPKRRWRFAAQTSMASGVLSNSPSSYRWEPAGRSRQKCFRLAQSRAANATHSGSAGARAQDGVGQVEPNAGSWKTWAVSSGKDFRVPPPPDAATTLNELAWLKTFSQEKDPSVAEQVRFWNAGAPSYRWVDVVTSRLLDPTQTPIGAFPNRAYLYVSLAIYDATIAAWGSKKQSHRNTRSQTAHGKARHTKEEQTMS